jgi:hypothetical protein
MEPLPTTAQQDTIHRATPWPSSLSIRSANEVVYHVAASTKDVPSADNDGTPRLGWRVPLHALCFSSNQSVTQFDVCLLATSARDCAKVDYTT